MITPSIVLKMLRGKGFDLPQQLLSYRKLRVSGNPRENKRPWRAWTTQADNP